MKKILLIGTFDFLHAGHINLFLEAKKYGEIVIGVTSDRLNKENKEKADLIFDQSERIKMIKFLRFVDDVFLIDPHNGLTIDKISLNNQITHLGVGDDHLNSKEKEDLAKRLNIDLLFFPRTEGISSTEVRDKIKLINSLKE